MYVHKANALLHNQPKRQAQAKDLTFQSNKCSPIEIARDMQSNKHRYSPPDKSADGIIAAHTSLGDAPPSVNLKAT